MQGSVLGFWASRIRIRIYLCGSGFLHQQAKKLKKNLDLNCFVISLRLVILVTDVNLPTESKKQKNLEEKLFC